MKKLSLLIISLLIILELKAQITISPSSGPVSTNVIINSIDGGLINASVIGVRFDGIPVLINPGGTDNIISFNVPISAIPNPNPYLVTLTVTGNAESFPFTVSPPPPPISISGINPLSGPPGTVITLTGIGFESVTGLYMESPELSLYTINGFNLVNSSKITFISQRIPEGQYFINAKTIIPSLTVPSFDLFNIDGLQPDISNFSPSFGLQGQSVTIVGSDLDYVTSVEMNGITILPSNYILNGLNIIIFNVPNSITVGSYPVELRYSIESRKTSLTNFTVTPPPTPSLISISTTSIGANMPFTISGTNLNLVNSLDIFSIKYSTTGANFIRLSNSALQIILPVLSNSFENTLSNIIFNGISLSGLNLTYRGVPTITSITTNPLIPVPIYPISINSDAFVTIIGANFYNVSSVQARSTSPRVDINLTNFRTLSATEIEVYLPFDMDYNKQFSFEVIAAGGTDLATSYKFLIPIPTLSITTVSPAFLGREIVVSGKGLFATSSLSLNGINLPFTKIDGGTLLTTIPSSFVAATGVKLELSNSSSTGFTFINILNPLEITAVNIGANKEFLTVTSASDFIQFTSTVVSIPANADTKGVAWSVLPNLGATITTNGIFRASLNGFYSVTGTSIENPSKISTRIVTASGFYVGVESLSISSPSLVRSFSPANNNLIMQALVLPLDATNKKINWTAEPTSLVQIDSNGRLTLKTETENGIVTITGISEDKPNLQSTWTMNVIGKTISVPGVVILAKSTDSNKANPCRQSLIINIPDNYLKYQWFVDGLKLVGATTSSVKPAFEGNYEVVVVDSVVRKFPAYKVSKSGSVATIGFESGKDTLLIAKEQGKYQWFLNNKIIVGASEKTLKVRFNGNYHVLIIDSNNCTNKSESIKIKKNDLKEFLRTEYSGSDSVISNYFGEETIISLFPNPAKESFTIGISNLTDYSSLAIYNVYGDSIYAAKINEPKTLISVSSWVKGIYIIVIDLNGKKERRRLSVF